ncbi:hypothetical protein BH23CHL3_BH23CHL3_07200 [soil metagenome]
MAFLPCGCAANVRSFGSTETVHGSRRGVMVDALQLIETGDKVTLFQPMRFLADTDQPGGMHRTPKHDPQWVYKSPLGPLSMMPTNSYAPRVACKAFERITGVSVICVEVVTYRPAWHHEARRETRGPPMMR